MAMTYPADSTNFCIFWLFLILSFPHHTLPLRFGQASSDGSMFHTWSLFDWINHLPHPRKSWNCNAESTLSADLKAGVKPFLHILLSKIILCSDARLYSTFGDFIKCKALISANDALDIFSKLGAQEVKWRPLRCSLCNVVLHSMNDWKNKKPLALTNPLCFTHYTQFSCAIVFKTNNTTNFAVRASGISWWLERD